MFAHPFIIAVGALCLPSTFLSFWEMIPALVWMEGRAGKGQVRGANIIGAVLLKQTSCPNRLFVIRWGFLFIFFILLPSVHLGLEATLLLCVSKAVETNLHRKAVCISNSWDAELTSSFIDLQGDACCADTLECMSPLPPSALCGHILNDHRRLWRGCVFVNVCVDSAIEQQRVLVLHTFSCVIEDMCVCTTVDLHYLSHTHTHARTPGQPSSWQGAVWLLIRVFVTPAARRDSALRPAASQLSLKYELII